MRVIINFDGSGGSFNYAQKAGRLDFHLDESPVHPREWFKRHVNEKPPVTLPNQSVTLDQVRATLKKQIFDQEQPEDDLVLLYLRKLAENMKSPPLDADWESFGILIGRAQESIGPLSLVSVVDCDTEVPMLAGSASEKDDNWMLIMLTAFYRLNHMLHAEYRKSLFQQLRSKLKQAGLSNFSFLEKVNYNSCLRSHSEFEKMMAVLDLYFVRFPQHPFSGARFGTGESRYKECTVLKSLLDLSEQIKMSLADISNWVWTRELKLDFRSIFKPDQEIYHPFSYAPYAKDLLRQKPVYSTANNSNLHLFIHAVGSALGFKRSINAKFVEKQFVCIIRTVPNAAIFAHALIISRQNQNDIVDYRPLKASFEKDSSNFQAEKTFAALQNWANLKDLRPGSIGEYVQSIAKTELNKIRQKPKNRNTVFE